MYKWEVAQIDEENVKQLYKGGLPLMAAEILVRRGYCNITDVKSKLVLDELSDPFLLKDMEIAVDILNKTIDEEKKICIYGDYDCDGITATVMLFSFLDAMGADVFYYVPEREEGYGMNIPSLEKIKEMGAELIITVDNGITAIKEALKIYELGMQLIITDHHQPLEDLPKSEAIINPHRKDDFSPFKELCGAGVVLKLIAALCDGNYDSALEQYADLAALGTVADIVPIYGENRFIVSRGLQAFLNTENPGLRELISVSAGTSPLNTPANPLKSSDLGFKLGPRINAASRCGSPKSAIELLLSDSKEEAEAMAQTLNDLNNERKKIEDSIMFEIEKQINSNPQLLYNRVLVFMGENWHHGVIGIIASRIEERFAKPAFILSYFDNEARGSARAFGDFNVFKALDYAKDVLVKYGGHKSAGGFSLAASDFETFNKKLQEYAFKNHNIMPIYTVYIDKLLEPRDLDLDTIDALNLLEPFGESNPQPLFLIRGAVVTAIDGSKDGKHTIVGANFEGKSIRIMIFHKSPEHTNIVIRQPYDFLALLQSNEWEGRKSVSIFAKDFRKSGLKQEKYFAAFDAYEKYLRAEELPASFYRRMLPARDELICVYKNISQDTDIDTLFCNLVNDNFNYCKLRVSIDIFHELGLLEFNAYNMTVSKVIDAPKNDLANSQILKELTKKCGEPCLTGA